MISLISMVAVLTLSPAGAADEVLAQTGPSGPPVAEAPAPPPGPAWPSDLEIERADGGTLHFRSNAGSPPAALKTALNDVQALGILKDPKGGVPYLLVTASAGTGEPRYGSNQAAEFDGDERMVFMLRADGARSTKFVHPGKVKSRESGEVVHDSRAFFGQCLPGKGDVYVVHQREKVDRRRYLQTSVFIAEPGPSGIQESLLTRRLPSLDQILRRARKGGCTEIAGISRKTAPRGNPSRPEAPPPHGAEPDEEGDEKQ